MRDAIVKNRKNDKGEKHPQSKLTEEMASHIKKMYREAEFDRGDKKDFFAFWGNKFSVSPGTIANVAYGTTWKHIK
jgi:hypothetical protein